jgi:hypothetical protein
MPEAGSSENLVQSQPLPNLAANVHGSRSPASSTSTSSQLISVALWCLGAYLV